MAVSCLHTAASCRLPLKGTPRALGAPIFWGQARGWLSLLPSVTLWALVCFFAFRFLGLFCLDFFCWFRSFLPWCFFSFRLSSFWPTVPPLLLNMSEPHGWGLETRKEKAGSSHRRAPSFCSSSRFLGTGVGSSSNFSHSLFFARHRHDFGALVSKFAEREPSVGVSSRALRALFWGEGSPNEIDHRKELVPTFSTLSTGGPSSFLGSWAVFFAAFSSLWHPGSEPAPAEASGKMKSFVQTCCFDGQEMSWHQPDKHRPGDWPSLKTGQHVVNCMWECSMVRAERFGDLPK